MTRISATTSNGQSIYGSIARELITTLRVTKVLCRVRWNKVL